MPRRRERPRQRDLGPQLKVRRVSIQVGDDEPIEVVGPCTIMELGHDRARIMAERARLIAEHFLALANRLEVATLDPVERHALADCVDDSWFALTRPGADKISRAAMEFIEAVDAGLRAKRDGELRSAIAKDDVEWPLDERDVRVLANAPTATVASLRAELAAKPELQWKWISYADYEPTDLARAMFSAAHSRTAVRIPQSEWVLALEAWERTTASARGTPTKWEILEGILRRVRAWEGSAEHLKRQWRAWKMGGGLPAPLNPSGDKQQAASHEQAMEQLPSRPVGDPTSGARGTSSART